MGTLPVDTGVRALVFAAKGDLLAAQIWRASNSFVQVWDASTAQRSPEQMLLKAPGTAIAHWRVAGPYQQPAIKSEDLLVFPFAPEQKPTRADWKSLTASNSILDLAAALPPPAGKPRICYYLQARIGSHSDQDALLFVGADGVLNISLNGAVVREIRIPRGVAWEHTVPLKLRQGNNEIIIKLVTRLGCRNRRPDRHPGGLRALPDPSR